MRLIDADELKIDFGFTWDDIAPTREEMFEIIDRQPTAEPKKGRWIADGQKQKHGHEWMHCTICGFSDIDVPATHTNFCPNCGTKMDGGDPDATD